LYETVKHLVPNHYLSLSGLEQKRYWPNKVPKKMQIEEAIKQSSYLLKNIMEAANHRFKLAMPMTAGWDSRIILSASKNIAKDLFFYTLQYRNLNPASNDIAFPKKLLQRLGYQHTIINCNKAINEHFLKIYRNNSDMAHEDWAKIANGMLDEFPADRVCIKGSCAEIARGGAYLNWKEMQFGTLEQILEYEQDWGIFDFTKNAVSQWLQATLPVLHGYKIETLFDWEHCMGSWQAQNQLEWDIVQETFTPFNNRELLDVLLSIDFRYRKWPNFRLFKKIIETLWKEVLSVPINSKNVVLKKVRNVFFSKILKRKG
jgi:hypothetical protein